MDEYMTVKDGAAAEFIERRSRFLGCIRPIVSEEEAAAFLSEQKTKYWDASHNVYAYLLRDGRTRRCSDDGEPQGTAGVPVLEVLQREGLTDVMVVVTRYFGGILLGAGGLVRAYSHGAKIAVDAAVRRRMCACSEFLLECGYELYGKIAYLLPQCGAKVLFSDFGAAVRLKILLKDSDVPRLEKALAEGTAAQVFPQLLERRFACMEEAGESL